MPRQSRAWQPTLAIRHAHVDGVIPSLKPPRAVPFSATEMSRFTPEEFRTAIQALMGEGRDALAYALGDAGLALYPESEDILAITSLLAVVREDWPQAVDLLKQLIDMQGDGATVFSYSMLIRSLRCNLDRGRF